jgi:hypothetical protein
MPDQWETEHVLNPSDPADGAAITSTGYSNLELYLNSLALVPEGGSINLITRSTVQRLGDGSYQATVTVTNNGTGMAQNVWLTSGKLGSSVGNPTQQPLVNIPAGAVMSTTMTFPASAGAPGTNLVERYTGTFAGGTFAVSIRRTLP